LTHPGRYQTVYANEAGSVAAPTAGLHFTPELLKKLNQRQEALLNLIRDRGGITSPECAKNFKISKSTARRDLKKLAELGIVVKRGSGHNTYYVLAGTSSSHS